MKSPDHARLATVEVHWGKDPGQILWIGNRVVHQFWPLLGPYFRDILLTPQRRTEEEIVAWTWREPAESKPATGAELAALRKRLTGVLRGFVENARDDAGGDGGAAGLRSQASIAQLASAMETSIGRLIAKSDAEFAKFVARTESGLRLHSWGVTTAATPSYPKSREREISGIVIDAGRPARGIEILLENAGGGRVAQVRSDAAGRFRFSKIASERYRVRAHDPRVAFPPAGLEVVVDRESVTGLELRSINDAPALARPPRTVVDPATRRRRRRAVAGVLALLPLAGLMWDGWRWWAASREESAIDASERRRAATDHTLGLPSARFGDARADAAERQSSAGGGAGASGGLGGISGGTSASRRAASQTPPSSGSDDILSGEAKRATTTSAREPAMSGDGKPLRKAATSDRAVASKQTADPLASSPESSPSPPSAAAAAEPPGSATGGASAAASGKAGASQSSAAGTADGAAAVHAGSESASASAAGAAASSEQKSTTAAGKVTQLARNPSQSSGAPSSPGATDSKSGKKASADAVEKTKSDTAGATASGKPAAAPAGGGTAAATPGSTVAGDSAADRDKPALEASNVSSRTAQQQARASNRAGQPAAANRRDSPAPESGGASAGLPADPSESGVGPAGGSWQHALRVSASGWRVRLLVDAILPTEPMRVGSEAAVESMRAKALAERRAQLPETFGHASGRNGIAVEIDKVGASPPLRWRLPAGAESVAAAASGHRAELAWVSGRSPSLGIYELVDDRDRRFARVGIEANGEATVQIVTGARAWFWLAVEHAAVDEAGGTPATRFSWRRLSGAVLPSAGSAAHEARLDVALSTAAGEAKVDTVALLDAVTGWAMATEIKQAPAAPP